MHDQQSWSALLQHVSDFVAVVGPDGTVLYANDASERMLSFHPRELVGTSVFALVHPGDLSRLEQVFADVVRSPGGMGSVEVRVRQREGVYRFVEIAATNRLNAPDIHGIVIAAHDLTPHKRAEEERARLEARYRSIFENAVEGMFQVSPDGRFELANRMLARIYGYDTPEQMMELLEEGSLSIYVDAEARSEMRRLLFEEGLLSGFETRVRRRDGQIIWVSINARAVRDEQGRVLRYEGTVMDVTDRRLAEEALRQSEERYRKLVEQSAEGIFLCDAETRQVIESNAAFRDLLGYTDEELRGMTLYDFIRHDRSSIDSNLAKTLEEGQYTIGDRQYRCKDGSIAHVEVKANVIAHGGRRVLCVVAHDVTARLRAEEALRWSEERYRSLVQHAPDIVGIVDRDGVVRYVSPAVQTVLGYSSEELLGRNSLDLVHRDDAPTADAMFGAVLAEPDRIQRTEFRMRHRDGDWRLLEVVAHNMLDVPSVRGIVVNCRDVTEQRLAQRQRAELLQQVEAALNMRNQFLSIVSHELRTPITLLKGYAELLQNRLGSRTDDPALLKPLAIMNRQVDRMARQIAELLDVSRIEAGKLRLEMEPFDLVAAVGEIVGEISVSSPEFRIGYRHDGQSVVRGDKVRVQQVVTNLLENAIKYSRDTQEVEVELRRGEREVTVSVRDRGIGVPAHQQQEVFNLYFRGENVPLENYGGLGLGLYISRVIVERHGGTMAVSSVEGEGSTFSFTLPLLEEDA